MDPLCVAPVADVGVLPAVGEGGLIGDPVVRLSGVTRLFGDRPAVNGVDLLVRRGEVVLLRGSNGAGKTTLLRIIATAIRQTYGRGDVLGFDLGTDRGAIRARTELLGHHRRLYEDLTARENLRFACVLHGIPPEQISSVLARVGLEHAADTRVRTYSEGMRQRVAIARVLLREPELLLMDEPYAGLDEHGRTLVDGVIEDARKAGRTVVFASHDARGTATADRVVVMEGGRIDPGGMR